MSKKPRSIESVRADIEDIISIGISLERKSYSIIDDQNVGTRVKDGRLYIISKDFRDLVRRIIEVVVYYVGSNKIDEVEVEEIFWNLIYRDTLKSESYKLFKKIISEYSLECTRFIIPNFQIRFEAGLHEIQIGPVRAVLGSKLVSEFREKVDSNWRFYTDNVYSADKADKLSYNFDAVCWDVEVRASDQVSHQQAVWEVDVALSLLRTMLLSQHNYGMFPVYGDKEVATGTRPDRRSAAFYQKNEKFSSEIVGIQPHYKITYENAKYLMEEPLRTKIVQVFDAKENTVAERVKRGLGWLTRARQKADQAERHLYFSTAIETLLTLEDKDAKVTEVIARNGSVILTDNHEDRFDNYKILVGIYGVRSRIIHGGSRNISRKEARLVQEVAELLYERIVLLTDLSRSYEDFQRSLKEASFGQKWQVLLK